MRRPVVLLLAAVLLAAVLLAVGPGRVAAQGAPPRVHRVQAGDTLDSVAARYGVTGGRRLLLRLNGLRRAAALRPGTGVLVPDSGAATAELPVYRPRAPFGGTLEACSLRAWGPAQPDALRSGPAGSSTACAHSPEGLRLCAVRAPGEGPLLLRLTRDAAVLRDQAIALRPGGDGAFEVADADLDGDGDRELVAAVRRDARGGPAQAIWTLAVFDAPDAAPLLVDVAAYGEGSFVRAEGDDGCDLLATAWRELDDPLRGRGRYLTGRRWRVTAGALVAPPDAPLVVRRDAAVAAVEREGGLVVAAPGRALAGLAETDALIWPDDELVGPPGPARSGRIAAATALAPGGAHGLSLQVALRSGDDVTLRTARSLPGALDLPGPPAVEGAFVLLGDDVSERPLPAGYVPADPGALVGRAVRLVPYETAADGATQVVWLAAP
jgi:LysM repeat protein